MTIYYWFKKHWICHKGLTLIELIITILISLILILIAVPSFDWLLKKTHKETLIDQLFTEVQLARYQAILRGEIITLCKSANQKSCGGRWTQGQLIFVDENGDHQVNGMDEILYAFHRKNKDTEKLTWKGFGGENDIQFYPTGFSQNGRFNYCLKNVVKTVLFLSQNGRLRRDEPSKVLFCS